jgi:hypothetical protein
MVLGLFYPFKISSNYKYEICAPFYKLTTLQQNAFRIHINIYLDNDMISPSKITQSKSRMSQSSWYSTLSQVLWLWHCLVTWCLSLVLLLLPTPLSDLSHLNSFILKCNNLTYKHKFWVLAASQQLSYDRFSMWIGNNNISILQMR